MSLLAIANRDAAQAIVDGLLAGGVTQAVLSPGSRSTPLVLALARAEARGALRLHTILDERAAAFFALGLARSSGTPVAILATSGSAGAHFYPAIIEAHESRVPLVVLTADRPSELREAGAPQTTDQRRLFGVHVAFSADLPVPEPGLAGRIFAAITARALSAARGAAPGPVHLNVPFREPLWTPEVEAVPLPPRLSPELMLGRPTLDGRARGELLDLLLRSPRGVFVVGPTPQNPRDAELGEALRDVARALSWPVLADAATSARSLPDTRELILRSDAILRSTKLGKRLSPELVVRIGRAPSSRAVGSWLGREAAHKAVLLDPAGAAADPEHTLGLVVAADPTSTLRAIAEELGAMPHAADPEAKAWLEAWKQAEARVDLELSRLDDDVLWEGAIPSLVRAALPEGGLIHLGNGMPIRDFDGFEPRQKQRRVAMASRGVNGIDGTLATAVGELIGAGGDRPLVAVIGDLTALHDLSGLRLAAEQRVPLVALVIDNGGGGIFDFLPVSQHPTAFGPHFLTPQSANIPAIAEALGLRSRTAATRAELAAALEAAIADGGPSLVCATVDRTVSVARHKKLWSDVERALDQLAQEEPRRGPIHDPNIQQSA
ncbi:MAG: 2-succinyl-5-enolpyruvyl-6-hydroxy-3-cyclohexene-1-carboxylic-acid synthase [Myxococcota bacterium]